MHQEKSGNPGHDLFQKKLVNDLFQEESIGPKAFGLFFFPLKFGKMSKIIGCKITKLWLVIFLQSNSLINFFVVKCTL
jgi:hypothetical protein